MAFDVTVSAVPILRDPPFVLALFVLGAALGRRALKLVRAPSSAVTPLEYGVVCTSLGCGLLQYLVLPLGMAGRLTPGALRVAFGVTALLLAYDIVAVVRALVRAVVTCDWRNTDRYRTWRFWLVVAVAPALLVAFLQTLTPSTDIDGISYHLGLPRRWLGVGRMEYVPTLFMAQLPLGLEMLYTAGLALWSENAARLIHFAFGLLTLAGVYALGRRMTRPNVAAAIAVVSVVVVPFPSLLILSTWAYNELGLACQMLAGAIAWSAWRRSGSSGWLAVAFACAGIVLTFKMTMGFYVLALGAATLVSAWRQGHARALGLSAAGCAVSLAVYSPWPLRAWKTMGNPFFPFLTNLFPTRDWSPEAAHDLALYYRYRVWGTGRLLGSLNQGEREILLLTTVAVCFALAAFLFWRAAGPDGRAVAILAGATTIPLLWNAGLYARFLAPLLPLWLLAIGSVAERRWRGRAAGAAALAVTVVGSVAYPLWSAPGFGESLAFALGRGDRDAYLSRCLPTYPMAKFANRALPPGSLILVAGAAAQYYYDAPMIFPDLVRMRCSEWDSFLVDLRRNGVTHLLVSETYFDPPPPGGMLPAQTFCVRRLVAERGRLLLQTPYDRLYAFAPKP